MSKDLMVSLQVISNSYCYYVTFFWYIDCINTISLVKQETAERKNTPNKIWKKSTNPFKKNHLDRQSKIWWQISKIMDWMRQFKILKMVFMTINLYSLQSRDFAQKKSFSKFLQEINIFFYVRKCLLFNFNVFIL